MSITIDASTFAANVARQRTAEPVIVPSVVGGQEYCEGPLVLREDPSHVDRRVSGAHESSDELVARAVAASRAAQRQWERVPAVERAARVRRGIEYVVEHADEWATRLALETGKTLPAITAEVDEVRGFLEVYSAFGADPDAFVDELDGTTAEMTSETILRPYGVFGVITPFNYPMALAANATIGAVVAGNGVVIKSSHQGPWSGQAIHELFAALDVPTGLVNIVHGGDSTGKALVASDIDGIGFTGSAAVGHAIIRQLSGGPYVKPVIAEMGGKNPVIVADSADVEAAVAGILYSGYDLAGQKCSSGSRILATSGSHDELVLRLGAAIRSMAFGDPVQGGVFAGPVTEAASVDRYHRLVRTAKDAGFAIEVGSCPEGEGYYVPPTVISGVPEGHELARDEHFLPITTVSKVETFEDALLAANDVSAGLTAGIFTARRSEALEFLERIEAGCINVNGRGHATTGFLPGQQTFGGWKGSGSTGKQAYGKWYLQQFAREQTRKFPANWSGLD